MSASRPPRPLCEFDRAYRDLIPSTARHQPDAPCSPEAPELRGYPAPPAGVSNYFLCNGHLSDLFDARDLAARIEAHPA